MKEPVIFVALFMEQFLYLSCRLLIVCVYCSVNLLESYDVLVHINLICLV
jgi:hypothetical protein